MPIFRLFPPCVHSNLLTANFILLRLPYFESITTYCVHLIVVKSLLLFFLISLLLLTQLTIKSCLIDLLPSMVSQVLPSPYFDPIFLIALIMLLFNLPPPLPSTLPLVSLRVLSLVLSFSLSTLLLLAISLKTLIFLFTYMPMILNFTSPFQALILLLLSHLYHMPLISIHLFSLQMLLFHPSLIIAIVFFTAYLIPPLNVCKEFKIPLPE